MSVAFLQLFEDFEVTASPIHSMRDRFPQDDDTRPGYFCVVTSGQRKFRLTMRFGHFDYTLLTKRLRLSPEDQYEVFFKVDGMFRKPEDLDRATIVKISELRAQMLAQFRADHNPSAVIAEPTDGRMPPNNSKRALARAGFKVTDYENYFVVGINPDYRPA